MWVILERVYQMTSNFIYRAKIGSRMDVEAKFGVNIEIFKVIPYFNMKTAL